MLLAHLSRWFARPAKRPVASDRPPVVPQLPACGPPLPAAVQVAANPTADGMVIRLKGEAGVGCAGALLDGLLTHSAHRPAVVTIDLSELRSISCLAVGVLAAYRRGVARTGGRVRLAGEVQPAVRESLVRADLYELFEPTDVAAPVPDRPS
jgi:anti-anti-sigma factor